MRVDREKLSEKRIRGAKEIKPMINESEVKAMGLAPFRTSLLAMITETVLTKR